jgi:hypothetical protein
VKAKLALALALTLSSTAWAQIESVYTDAEAASKAKQMLKDARGLRSEVTELCVAKDAQPLYEAANRAKAKLAEWPDDHLKYRSLFPYGDCRQAMMDVDTYAMICAIGGYKGEAVKYDQRRWQEDTSACEAAIREPDLSLKDIQ